MTPIISSASFLYWKVRTLGQPNAVGSHSARSKRGASQMPPHTAWPPQHPGRWADGISLSLPHSVWALKHAVKGPMKWGQKMGKRAVLTPHQMTLESETWLFCNKNHKIPRTSNAYESSRQRQAWNFAVIGPTNKARATCLLSARKSGNDGPRDRKQASPSSQPQGGNVPKTLL